MPTLRALLDALQYAENLYGPDAQVTLTGDGFNYFDFTPRGRLPRMNSPAQVFLMPKLPTLPDKKFKPAPKPNNPHGGKPAA